jgi:hypothetical protein
MWLCESKKLYFTARGCPPGHQQATNNKLLSQPPIAVRECVCSSIASSLLLTEEQERRATLRASLVVRPPGRCVVASSLVLCVVMRSCVRARQTRWWWLRPWLRPSLGRPRARWPGCSLLPALGRLAHAGVDLPMFEAAWHDLSQFASTPTQQIKVTIAIHSLNKCPQIWLN